MNRTFSALLIWFLVALCVPSQAFSQDDPSVAEEPVVTHGGYGALGGAVGFALMATAVAGAGGLIYSPPRDVDCEAEPARCRPRVWQHGLMVAATAAGGAGVYFAGYGSQKLAESFGWNPVLGWSLAGAYLALPATLLLQTAIPRFKPEWSREVLGAILGAAGSVGGGYAFRAIARERGHAWPEFGFGAGGMLSGLVVGALVAPESVWMPVLGGVGAVLGASAAALAF